MHLKGTAFLLGRDIPETTLHLGYVVTARHVIEMIAGLGLASVWLRCNLKDGGLMWIETSTKQWLFHPNDPEVDVAVLSANIPGIADHLLIPLSRLLDHKQMCNEGIGVGEDVFIAGLFIHHAGVHRNIPIIRTGSIASLDEEKVATNNGLRTAYLIEARSIGGLSGSPVFAHQGIARVVDGRTEYSTLSTGVFHQIGMILGHWDTQVATGVDAADEDAATIGDKVNVGIAMITPGEKILEVINQKTIEALDVERKKALMVLLETETELKG